MTGPPITPPLEPEELDHYELLIAGLLTGCSRLARRTCPDQATIPEAIEAVQELVDELVARVREEVERR